MNDYGKCLCCYENLDKGLYHRNCSIKLFGTPVPPVLDYSLSELTELAESNVVHSVAVPGVQPKMSLTKVSDKRTARLTFVGLNGDYILKPQTNFYPFLPENESLTMRMAEEAGIETATSGLLPLRTGELVYVTLRMDRGVYRNNKIQKIVRHMEDFCQITEHMTEDKYKGSMELVAKTIRKYSTQQGYDLTRLLDLMLFIFLTGNGDMHLKNFSLLYDGAAKVLSPAYDLLSTRLVIPEKDDPEEFAMPMSGKKSNFKKADFVRFTENSGLKDVFFERTIKRLSSHKERMLALISMSFLPQEMKEDYKKMLLGRAARIGL
jgi:serine/threonine-protein kinase HipA